MERNKLRCEFENIVD